MLFEDYWNKTCEKNTAFKNKEVIEIKVSIIKKLMHGAYNEGIDFNIYSSKKDDISMLKNLFNMK